VEKRRALNKASRPNKRSRPVVLEEAVVKAQNAQEGKAMTGSYLDWAAVRKLAAERIARGKALEKVLGTLRRTTRTKRPRGVRRRWWFQSISADWIIALPILRTSSA
jgi:hypothetical protein